MLTLVVNLGSTSFKHKLFDLAPQADAPARVVASGRADRVGVVGAESSWHVQVGEHVEDGTVELPDHAGAIALHLDALQRCGAIGSPGDLDAIGFKAVHGGPISGAVQVDKAVLATMQRFSDVAPAHNPPYIAAMKAFARRLPKTPQVAAFETGFHQTIPLARQIYAIPWQWTHELGIRRYGFHGASHRYIATRLAELEPGAKRVVSLHLGGSCSIGAIEEGRSVANSFGMTAQSGVFHNNRVGDFDAFAMLKLIEAGHDLPTIWHRLAHEGGLLGISGVSGDMRDVREAAEAGHERAKLAIEAFVESCRHHLGASLVALGGADAICFTGGIGEHEPTIRAAVCDRLAFAGVSIDAPKNAGGEPERRIDADDSGVAVWVVPTDEELIVARQTVEVIETMREAASGQKREAASGGETQGA